MIEFVDTCMCGDYHMTIDRSEKDALKYTPNGGLTMFESLGRASKTDRFTHGGLEQLGRDPMNSDLQTKEFDRLEQWSKLQKPPTVKFKDLEEVVSHKISVNLMPFDVRADFVKVTGDTVLVPVTIQVKNRDVTFTNKDGVQRGTVNIFGRVTTLSGQDRADLRRYRASGYAGGIAAQSHGKFLDVLEGTAPAAEPVPDRYRGEGCKR